jgi:hypothetical protein
MCRVSSCFITSVIRQYEQATTFLPSEELGMTATSFTLLALKKRVRNEFNNKNHAHSSSFPL